MRPIRVARKEKLFDENEIVEEMFFVRRGIISLCMGSEFDYVKIMEIRKNEHFGDIFCLSNQRTPYLLKVSSIYADLLIIRKHDLWLISEEFPESFAQIFNISRYNHYVMLELTEMKKKKIMEVKKIEKSKNLQIDENRSLLRFTEDEKIGIKKLATNFNKYDSIRNDFSYRKESNEITEKINIPGNGGTAKNKFFNHMEKNMMNKLKREARKSIFIANSNKMGRFFGLSQIMEDEEDEESKPYHSQHFNLKNLSYSPKKKESIKENMVENDRIISKVKSTIFDETGNLNQSTILKKNKSLRKSSDLLTTKKQKTRKFSRINDFDLEKHRKSIWRSKSRKERQKNIEEKELEKVNEEDEKEGKGKGKGKMKSRSNKLQVVRPKIKKSSGSHKSPLKIKNQLKSHKLDSKSSNLNISNDSRSRSSSMFSSESKSFSSYSQSKSRSRSSVMVKHENETATNEDDIFQNPFKLKPKVGKGKKDNFTIYSRVDKKKKEKVNNQKLNIRSKNRSTSKAKNIKSNFKQRQTDKSVQYKLSNEKKNSIKLVQLSTKEVKSEKSIRKSLVNAIEVYSQYQSEAEEKIKQCTKKDKEKSKSNFTKPTSWFSKLSNIKNFSSFSARNSFSKNNNIRETSKHTTNKTLVVSSKNKNKTATSYKKEKEKIKSHENLISYIEHNQPKNENQKILPNSILEEKNSTEVKSIVNFNKNIKLNIKESEEGNVIENSCAKKKWKDEDPPAKGDSNFDSSESEVKKKAPDLNLLPQKSSNKLINSLQIENTSFKKLINSFYSIAKKNNKSKEFINTLELKTEI